VGPVGQPGGSPGERHAARPQAESGESAATAAHFRRARVRMAAVARGVPLATIIAAVAVVVLTFLAGKLIYRLRDVILIVVVAGSSP